MTTPKPTLPQPWNLLETLIQTYALMALAGSDQELKDGYFVRLGQDLSRKSQSNHVVLIGMIFSKNDMKQVFAEWSDFTSTKQ